MCGIVGILLYNKKRLVAPFLRESLKRLEYRGYDSVGIATLDMSTSENNLLIKKDKGKIDEIHERINLNDLPGYIGIGHTRWATHGPPAKRNAHPHTDCTNRIAVVHNGIIENFVELKKALREKGHVFKSETDTEVICHLIEDNMMKNELNLKEAVRKSLKQLHGSFAIAVISSIEPDKIVCARKESPLVLGIGNDGIYCASDIPAFLPMTNKAIILHDNEMAVLTEKNHVIFHIPTGRKINKEITEIKWSSEMASKGGYQYFMLKEIHEQPRAVKDTVSLMTRVRKESLEKIAKTLEDTRHLYITAAGTSFHAGLAGKYMLAKLAKLPSQAIISSEFPETVLHSLPDDATILSISQSGETADTIRALRYSREICDCSVVSIVNVVGSTVARESDHVFYIQAGPEIGVAATKTFCTQVASLGLISVNLAERRGTINPTEAKSLYSSLLKTPKIVEETIRNQEAKIKDTAERFASKSNFLFLGRGISTATALEGALKLKEISYAHAEGFPAGESKHGAIALVEQGFPVVFTTPKDETYSHIIGNIMEMKARGATIISVSEKRDTKIKELSDVTFQIPPGTPDVFTPITYVVPHQLFAYYSAVKRGYSPDMPRNLAKSVTVL